MEKTMKFEEAMRLPNGTELQWRACHNRDKEKAWVSFDREGVHYPTALFMSDFRVKPEPIPASRVKEIVASYFTTEPEPRWKTIQIANQVVNEVLNIIGSTRIDRILGAQIEKIRKEFVWEPEPKKVDLFPPVAVGQKWKLQGQLEGGQWVDHQTKTTMRINSTRVSESGMIECFRQGRFRERGITDRDYINHQYKAERFILVPEEEK